MRAQFVLWMLLGAGLAAWSLLPAVFDANSPSNPRFIMRALATQLSQQYHQCVPLGWAPQPVAGSYYPAYSAEYRQNGVWLRPYWLGMVPRSGLTHPKVRQAYGVLNALVRAGLLVRTSQSDGTYYRLTLRALPYYFDDNGFGDNPDHFPYLCYSRLLPTRVRWTRPAGSHAVRVQFVWRPGPAAPWADDPFLRKHSVVLPPLGDPVVAVFSDHGGQWYVKTLLTRNAMLPRVTDVAAWQASAP